MKGKLEPQAVSSGATSEEPIAIVSFGGVFPGARNLEEFWSILERGVDVSRPVPPGRWILSPQTILTSMAGTPDRVYTDRGCFIDSFRLNAAGLKVPAAVIEALDPSVHLLLEAGRMAWGAARTESTDRSRVGIVLGNIALPTSASSALCEQVLTPLLEYSGGWSEPSYVGGYEEKALRANALNRYVVGLPAGVLGQALGFGGGTSTVDAACASSLYALKLACDELRAGRADAMLAGGLSRPDSLYTQMGFCQLRALSQSGRCAPFDAAGSGLIVGEGAGVLVLKRLTDALRDSDTIHAVVRGIGLSNDVEGNLLSPDSEGQLRALHQAYQQAGWSPDQVDFIECHATGTPVGDAVEFESLSRLWHDYTWRPGQCALGAVKANIGHLLTAAGSASLIKVLLALKHQTLPPMANFSQPAERIPLAGSPFRIPQQSQPWDQREGGMPRRAAVNGFGFGGINAHVLIEEWLPETKVKARRVRRAQPGCAIAIVGLGANVGSWPTLRSFQHRVLGGGSDVLPKERDQWRGVANEDLRAALGSERVFPGYYLGDLAIPVNRYRIPPKELAELLPQQALMLETARAALLDAETSCTDPTRAGVFIGLGLDLRTTDFHFRWTTLARAASEVGEASGLPLTADRTMGALAGINASRIAKEFHFGGPSFTVCSEGCSGTRAMELAVRALQLGEIDQALAGAVDLTGDPRTLLATDAVRPYCRSGASRPFDLAAEGAVPGEGAVALVLKRLEDARRDGDRIYAVVRGIGSAGGGGIGPAAVSEESYRQALARAYAEADLSPASVGYVEAHGAARPEEDRAEARTLSAFFGANGRKTPCRLGSAKADVGHVGAAAGLVSVVKASLALYQEILPPLRGLRQPLPELGASLLAPVHPQFWVRDRADGPRRAGVSASSVDGNTMHVVLEAAEEQDNARVIAERSHPLGPCAEALLVFRAVDQAGLLERVERLRARLAAQPGASLAELAQAEWMQVNDPASRWSLAVVAQDVPQLLRLLDLAADRVQRAPETAGIGLLRAADRDRIFLASGNSPGGVAFVFPGAGNCFAEMGRELALAWPEVLRAQDRESENLASQMFVDRFWNVVAAGQVGTDHRAVICGQVALGTITSDLAMAFGIKPEAVLGYSLGESTGLFALRAWTARDEMWRRVSRSTLFTRDLTGTPERLRRVWRVPAEQTVEWQAGLVDRAEAEVRAAIAGRTRIYVLIVNTPSECVVGGDAAEVRALVAKLGCHWFPLEGVSTVHCELLRPVEAAYRRLHLFETSAPAGVRFFSGGWGRAYTPDRETAADAIVAQAGDCIDFPRVVRAAYESGVRVFLELGPGNSCSRMIGQILDRRPHVARSLCPSAQEPLLGVLRVLGELAVQGVPLDLSKLFEPSAAVVQNAAKPGGGVPFVRIPISGPPLFAPSEKAKSAAAGGRIGRQLKPESAGTDGNGTGQGASRAGNAVETWAASAGLTATTPLDDPFEAEVLQAMAESQSATLGAHQAYLDFSQRLQETLSRSVESQFDLIRSASQDSAVSFAPTSEPVPVGGSAPVPRLDRSRCLEFARGSVAAVLGPEFAPVDSLPTRVRLPDEPLMLVDRILEIQGEPRSMTRGRVTTEHDILAGAWYLDGGRIPTCIAVEAGQADLFLSGYLGIDFKTQGRAVYRLLDARVCFHRGLPGPGEVIHYDIHIDHFFRQGDTWLFRFNFEATVDGQPLLTMTHGCAGFFSAEELANGRGIVRTTMDLKPMPGKRPSDWEEFVPMDSESYSNAQLEALRAGDLAGCFGPQFAGLAFRQPLTLPSGRMNLVHRIPHLDPTGGRFGLGLIRGEADIHPEDWFLKCHFVDDRVMPGTLMFECCLHTLRVFLLRLGWVAEQAQVVLEPVPGIASQLKCRGQVLETTATVTYEVSIKEIGYRPEPYVVADALMYADGKPIVEITNMNLRYAGLTRDQLRQTWAAARVTETSSSVNSPEAMPAAGPAPSAGAKRALYDFDRILAFAVGKPSVAFGAPYQVFDEQRRIARLPGPPYQFLDRITEVQGETFKMVPGASAEAQYDVPADAWYFAENRQGDMPFAVLLEIALQPCGWLAAYVGSALTSDVDLSFRNLGGTGEQSVPVYPDTGTLTTRVKLTRVSSSAGMIIQWFDFEVRAESGLIYKGDTYFGFFPQSALARQEGIQTAKLYQLADAESTRGRSLPYPVSPPFAGEQLRMVDHIGWVVPDGGAQRLGFIRGTKQVRPDEWFFKAHFYQDPVVPGSLGLESFLQLLKFLAIERWGGAAGSSWEAVAMQAPHEWLYRGQIIPTDHLVTVEAGITAVDDQACQLTADGLLSVDGRVIYSMKNFTVRRRASGK